MNTKSIIIGVVVVLIVIIGAFFLINGANQQSATQQQNVAANNGANGAAQPQQQGTTTPQVQAQEVTAGTGAQATPGSEVSVLYVGKLQDGTVFDSSAAHGNQPLTFTLGAKELIAGFQIGVNGMKEGGERLIAVPPTLGYGDQDVKDQTTGKVIIPANSTLVFDIKLVKVGTPSTNPGTTGAAQPATGTAPAKKK